MKIITNIRYFAILSLTISVFTQNLGAISAIIATLRYPDDKIIASVEKQLIAEGKLQKKINGLGKQDPTKVSKKRFKNGLRQYLPTLSGFVGLYGGYIAYSDQQGTISFPLLHKEPRIYLVITPNIKPNIIHGNTISHLTLLPEKKGGEIKAKIYLLEKKKQSVKKNKQSEQDETPGKKPKKKIEALRYWKVTEQKIPENNRVNPLSLVIITKPKNVYFPAIASLTSELKHLVLPPIYVLNDSSNDKIIIDFLDMTRYFEPIVKREKTIKDIVNQILIKNL